MTRPAAVKNPANAFEKIAMQHLDAVYRMAYALSGRSDTADDLTQATFLKALQNFGSYRMNTNAKAWLLRILRNTWIDQLRRIKTAGPRMPLDQSLADSPPVNGTVWSDAQDLLENFADDVIINALARLAAEQRLTLFLIDVEGLSCEEVAGITSVAVGTVKSRTSRARAALKTCLADHARQIGWAGERT